MKYSSGYCKHCRKQVKIEGQSPNHILHLLLSIITGGLWLIVWIILCCLSGKYRCPICGCIVENNSTEKSS